MTLVIRAKDDEQSVLACCDDVVISEKSWYFLPEKVNLDKLVKTERTYNCPYKGVAYWYDLVTDDDTIESVAWVYEDPESGWEHIAGRIAFYGQESSATIAIKAPSGDSPHLAQK